jgi:L-seryl-tRNA(Ser) seleniumtransferase
VKAEVFVPEVANHVPHVRITWDGPPSSTRPAEIVRALQDGEPSIVIRAEGESLVVGVWMMQPGEDKVVARRLRQELEKRA